MTERGRLGNVWGDGDGEALIFPYFCFSVIVLEILFSPFREVERFLNIGVDLVPNNLQRRGFSFEDYVVSLFPYVLEDEAHIKLADAIDDRVCEVGLSPVLQSVF